MQMTCNSGNETELIVTLDHIRELFIRNEDSLALQGLGDVLQKLESIAQGKPALEQETFRQLLLQSLKCLETKDYVRLTDILIYEIIPLLKTERG